MKQTRRKELKTNELSIYLQQLYETARRNSSYLIGGAVIVAAILIVIMLVQRNIQAKQQATWTTYYNLRDEKDLNKPDMMEQVRKLVEDNRDDGVLGPRALELQGDLACRLAMQVKNVSEQEKQIDLLKDAQNAYEQALSRFGNDTEVAARIRMSLASVMESLLVKGQGDKDAIAKLYQAVADTPDCPFKTDAKKRLETLTERLVKLEIVATRPAEPPASQPATMTIPPISVKPVTPAVPPPPPAPASAPASAPAK